MHQGAKVDALEGISDAAEEKRACDVVEEVGREADVHREEDMAEACSSESYKYVRAWSSQRKIVYRCSKYRTGCKGKMEYTIAAMGYTTVRAPKCSDNVVASSIRNVEAEMKAQSDLLAIENVAWPARQVWEERRSRFYDGDNPDVVHGLSESQVIRRVHVARSQHYSGNVHGSIEIPPLSLALDEEVSFFQLHYATKSSLTQCPCLALIDNDFAPKTYAEWMNPKNVTAKVTQLATMGLLQIVQLTNRNLQVLPEEIRGCTEMRYIRVEGKATIGLVGLPVDMFDEMSSLTTLHISTNVLTRLPSLHRLTNLKMPALAASMALEKLPAFHKLERLVIAITPLLDSLPDFSPIQDFKSFVTMTEELGVAMVFRRM
ncbi:Leucine-rich repeat domain, L domain-like [Phytophthora cactorum]|nr:Leucine-rich repeat domain, L domain-like [Phytophthora cactorum]